MRRGLRTTAAAATAALMLAALTACGSDGSSGEDGGDGPVELTYWTHTHPPMIDLNKELIAEYEAKHPEVTIKYEQIPNNEFGTKMLTALSNGSGPDIINMDDSALRGEYIPKDLLAPIDPAAFGKGSAEEIEAGYVAGTLDGAKGQDGQLYGVPSEFNATAFAINKAHFADAGLDPSNPPETWDEVAAAGKKLVAKGHEGFNFVYLHSGWYSQQLQTLLNETGGSILTEDGTESALDEPQSVEALRIWSDLINRDKVGNADTASREATVPFDDFASGRRSMTMIYPWAVDQLKADNPGVFKDVEVVPLPQVDPANPTGRWYAYYFAVNKASEHQREAWKFIQYLASQSERWLTDVNFVQPVTGWEESTAAKENIPFLDVWSQAYSQGKFDEVAPHWSEVQDEIKAAVERSVFDGVPPEESLKQASEAIDGILAN
jgi:ABC-type glycerol-3-phosphate transport system substrate-binding protein